MEHHADPAVSADPRPGQGRRDDPAVVSSSAPETVSSRERVVGRGVRWLSGWSWRWVLVVAVLVLVAVVVQLLWSVLLPVVLALVVTTVLAPPAEWLERHWRFPRALAAAVVLLLALALFVGVIALMVPTVSDDVVALADSGTDALTRVSDLVSDLGFSQAQVDDVAAAAQSRLQGSANQIATGVIVGIATIGHYLVNLILTLVLTFFFLKDGYRFLPWLDRWTGERSGGHLTEVARRSWTALGTFIRTQALVGLIDATLIGAGLLIVGVPLAFPLMLLTFLAAFAPVVGAITVGFLAVLVALVSQGVVAAVIIAVVVLLVQQLEGNVLLPWLQSRSLDLHAAVVLLAIVLGSTLFGVAGAFFAVPVTAIAVVVARYVDEQIRERTDEPSRAEVAEDLDEAPPAETATA